MAAVAMPVARCYFLIPFALACTHTRARTHTRIHLCCVEGRAEVGWFVTYRLIRATQQAATGGVGKSRRGLGCVGGSCTIVGATWGWLARGKAVVIEAEWCRPVYGATLFVFLVTDVVVAELAAAENERRVLRLFSCDGRPKPQSHGCSSGGCAVAW